MRRKLVFFVALLRLETQNGFIYGTNCDFEKIFYRKNFNLTEFTIKLNEIMTNIMCSQETLNLDNSSEKKTKFKKISLAPKSTLD